MLRLAISPCPNDTFAFYALLHGRVECGLELSCDYMDIEALNQAAVTQKYDFCKVSFHAYLGMTESHWLLDSGSALGFGCGPMIVGKGGSDVCSDPLTLKDKTIAVPGMQTTAFLLLDLFLGGAEQVIPMPFDQIMPAVEEGRVDCGLIIHESRFTYQQHGLVCLRDLGDWWEQSTGNAIPLGGIVARRSLAENDIRIFDEALKASIDYAWKNQDEVQVFMRQHAQEMDVEVMMNHVRLYVNDYTRSLGPIGRGSIRALMKATGQPAKADERLFFGAGSERVG